LRAILYIYLIARLTDQARINSWL